MKPMILIFLAASALPFQVNAQQSFPGTEAVKAAVSVNAEVRSLVQAITSHRRLTCAKLSASDVTTTRIKNSEDNSSNFTAVFHCNDPKYGANVHELVVSGVAFAVGPKTEILLTNFGINGFE